MNANTQRLAPRRAAFPVARHAGAAALAVLLLLGAPAGAQAADLAAGKAKAQQVCASCHGLDGVSVTDPSYPVLAGQHRDYLVASLLAYQRETRRNAIMVGMAKPLSRAEIEAVAAYYASLPSPLATRK